MARKEKEIKLQKDKYKSEDLYIAINYLEKRISLTINHKE